MKPTPPLSSPKPMDRQIVHPRGEPTTMTLLKEHSIKLSSDDTSLYI